MRLTIQRVKYANCVVDGVKLSEINDGYLILVGFTHADTIDNVNKAVKKVINLRVFNDNEGLMNLSIKDVKGEILAISQFTLYANSIKGNRPSFVDSMNKVEANNLYEIFIEKLTNEGINTKKGSFGNHMNLNANLDGPVTINIEL